MCLMFLFTYVVLQISIAMSQMVINENQLGFEKAGQQNGVFKFKHVQLLPEIHQNSNNGSNLKLTCGTTF